MNFFDSKRKGVTPVIAVLLLLMMTVAAAGGAYVWMTSLQEQLRSQTQEEVESFDRSISMSDLDCYNKNDKGKIDVLFKNSGSKTLDLNPVDMEVHALDTGGLMAGLSRFGINLADNDGRSEGVENKGSTDGDFADVNSVSYLTIETGNSGQKFEPGKYYTISFIFKDEDGYRVEGRCQTD